MIGMAIIAVLLCVNFAACSNDDDPTEEKEKTGLVGTWQGKFDYGNGEYQIAIFTFTSDGKFTEVLKGYEDGEDYNKTFKGTYTYDEYSKKIETKVTKDNEVDIDEYYVKSISATTLIINDWSNKDDIDGEVFIRQ